MRGNILHKPLLSTFSPVLCILILHLVYSQADDASCNKCVDVEGKLCNDVIRRFSSSKFWIMKGDKMGSHDEAVEECQRLGFQIAEINSEAEQLTFAKLATAEQDRYWVGFVKQGNAEQWTKMDEITPLSWQAPILEEDYEIEISFKNSEWDSMKAISVDSTGAWYSSSIMEQNHIVCQFPVTSPCYRGNGKKAASSQLGKVTRTGGITNDPACPEPEFENNQFVRTGPNSKFLYPKRMHFTSSTEATALCNNLGLEPAIINGKWEYRHLASFIYDMNLNNTRINFKVNLGAFNSETGEFKTMDRAVLKNYLLKFQDFNLKDGEYFARGADCLGMEWFRASHYFIPISCDKKSEVMPLCQYKANASCSTESPTALQDKNADLNKMFKVGESETNVYYGAMKQKTWHEADQFCKSNNLKLVGFQKGNSEMIKEKLQYINEYRKNLGTGAWSGFAWTSGRFRHEHEYIFDIDSEPWNIHENYTYWKWNDELTVDRLKESCLLITGDGMRPVLCELPNYFVCYSTKTQTTTQKPHENDTDTDSDMHRGTITDQKPTPTEPSECENSKGILAVSFTPGGLTGKEIIGLITTSIYKNFSKGLSESLAIKQKSRWRIPHVKQMGELTKLVCPEEHVHSNFIHLLSNFMLLYYNSVEEMEIPPIRETFWEKIRKKYSDCKSNSSPLTFTSTGGLITEFSDNGKTSNVNIANEKADSFPVLDYMLEGLWYMFEITAATCYQSTDSKMMWLSDYFYYFRKDFTDQFKKWWVNPGETNYGLLFGDMDLYESLYNLRACAVASFDRLEIGDILLVRPVDVDNGDYIGKTINQRT